MEAMGGSRSGIKQPAQPVSSECMPTIAAKLEPGLRRRPAAGTAEREFLAAATAELEAGGVARPATAAGIAIASYSGDGFFLLLARQRRLLRGGVGLADGFEITMDRNGAPNG